MTQFEKLLQGLTKMGYSVTKARRILQGILKEKSLAKSSFLSSVSYDKEAKTLDLKFKRGSEYVYSDVSEREFRLLKGASSHGREYNRRVRNHPFVRVS